MLLAKREPQNTSPNWNSVVHSYYIIVPSDSATLLLKAVAIRELLLPSTFPALVAEQPERAHGPVEVSDRQPRANSRERIPVVQAGTRVTTSLHAQDTQLLLKVYLSPSLLGTTDVLRLQSLHYQS